VSIEAGFVRAPPTAESGISGRPQEDDSISRSIGYHFK